jgi:hypothetical protein
LTCGCEVEIDRESIVAKVRFLERRAALEYQCFAKDGVVEDGGEHMAQRIVALHVIDRHLQAKRLGAQSVA